MLKYYLDGFTVNTYRALPTATADGYARLESGNCGPFKSFDEVCPLLKEGDAVLIMGKKADRYWILKPALK